MRILKAPPTSPMPFHQDEVDFRIVPFFTRKKRALRPHEMMTAMAKGRGLASYYVDEEHQIWRIFPANEQGGYPFATITKNDNGTFSAAGNRMGHQIWKPDFWSTLAEVAKIFAHVTEPRKVTENSASAGGPGL